MNIQSSVFTRLRDLAKGVLGKAKQYDYVITDGGKPEGEGWERTPNSDNPNSWRREKKPKNAAPSKRERPEHVRIPYGDFPEGTRVVQGNFIKGSVPFTSYMEGLNGSPAIADKVDEMNKEDITKLRPFKLVYEFGDYGYNKTSATRQKLSSLACRCFGTDPDKYSIKELGDDSEAEVEEFRKFTKAAQMTAQMSGFVDEDGYVTVYRGTDKQIKDGKYKGANCESWTVNPKSAFACSSLIKARIPVERVIGCYASDHKLYCCNEKELTICTSGLDFEFKDLLDGTDRSTDAALKVRDQEQSNAEKRIKVNLTKMMGDEAKNLDFSRPGYERLPEESRKKLFDYIKSQMTSDDAAAVDRNTPQDILDLLAESENYEVRQKVAANESTSKDTMMKLAQDPDTWVRIKLSANQAAPAEALTALMDRNDSWTYDLGSMRMNIAHHPNATPEILSRLAEDKDSEVRRLTAANPNLAAEDQLKLAKDERLGVRLVLARNPSATKEALEIIASEKYPSMAQEEAAKRLKKMDSSQPDMETPVTQEEKKQLEDYLSGKGIDRKAAAKDGQTPPEILGLLIRDNPEGIMHDLAENKNSPEWVLNGLANSEYKSVRLKVALNPSASENTMLKLARDEDDVVQRTLLGNPSITMKVREVLAGSKDTFLRYYQAHSFSAPPEILDKLCKDPDESVRSAVADNKNTSEETLKKMLDDTSSDIRKHVQERLDQLEKQKPKPEPKEEPEPPKPEPPKQKPKEEPKPQEKKPEEQPADSGNSYGLGTLKLFMKHGNAQTKKFAENEFKKQMQQREDDCINQLDGDKEAYEQLKDYKKSIGGKKGHGRTPEQVKQDFVKNMDPSKYGSPELFQKAKERIQKMPVGKFEALMAAIYDDDVEMFDQMKEGI